jgi:hypothetical protein
LSTPAFRNKNRKADDEPVDAQGRNSAERDPLKLSFDQDQQQEQQISSSACGKEQSERAREQCQGEKPEGGALQCERAPAPKQDTVLPVPRRSEQEWEMFNFCRTLRTSSIAGALLGICMFAPISPAQEGTHLATTTPPFVQGQASGGSNDGSILQNSLEVIYRDGQLTIHARNTTLAEVLSAVAEKTGALIDVPPESGLDRIVEQAGPGPADAVLAHLLNGSAFGFVILGSPQSPHALTRVLLLPHATGSPKINPTGQSVASAPSVSRPRLYGAGFSGDADDEDSASSAVPTPQTATETQPSQAAPDERLSGEVLDRMQKERLRQRQAQMQQPATPNWEQRRFRLLPATHRSSLALLYSPPLMLLLVE